MAVLREALRLVKRQADGSYQSNNVPLGNPGEGGLCALSAIAVELATGADALTVTDGGDWLVDIGGVPYTIVLGIEQDVAEILLLGNAGRYAPPITPIYQDGLSATAEPPVRVAVDGTVIRQYAPGRTMLAFTREQAALVRDQLTRMLDTPHIP